MKTKYLVGFFVISLALVGSVAWAQNVQYPVKELGDCKDEAACKSYCDKPGNAEACVNFAEKNNLMSKEEINAARKFLAAGSKGPGGCTGKDNCENFCNDITHIDECVAYAEKNNLMSVGELDEAKRVQAAIKRGVKPPACKNKAECDTYCEDSSHMEECVSFGIEAGFIQGKELEDSQKMLAAIKKGIKPLPCKGKEACDAYCSSPDNIEACMTFAKAAGFMTPEEAQNSEKMIAAIKKGVKPPQCKGKEACDAYCAEDAHVDECINFSIAAGFMSEKDAEMARKTGGKGPGGCKGKDECEAFCNNPDNQETCFNFAKENGMISEDDMKKIEDGRPGAGGDIPPAGKINPDRKFQPGPGTENPGGQMMPQQAGPGGCKGPEECRTYCESHPDDCKNSPQPQENRERTMQSQENREGMMQPQINQQPQSTEPGGGEGMTPGDFVPLAPPTEQTAPAEQMAPAPEPAPVPAPEPAPQTMLKYSPFGAIFNFFLGR